MLGYGEMAPKYPQEMPRRLVELGYTAAVVGKNHYGWNGTSPRPRGFQSHKVYDGLGSGKREPYLDDYDQWFQEERPGQNPLKSGHLGWNTWRGAAYAFPEELHPTSWTGRLAKDKLRQLAAADRPFFLKVSFHRPHSPYDPPERLLNSTLAPSRPPAMSKDGWDSHFATCLARFIPQRWCGHADESDLELTRRAYSANIRFVDEQIGALLAVLNETTARENTVVLFSSDHGDMQMDHFLWRKGYPYEGAAHVPLVIWWPTTMDAQFRLPRGSNVTAVTELRDFFPTLLDLAGHWDEAQAADFDGRPLTQLLRGPQDVMPKWRQWIDLEHNVELSLEIHWSALTDGVMKYIFHAQHGTEQLFNLTADPDEATDVSRDPSLVGELALWRSRLVAQFESEGRGPGWVKDGKLVPRWPCLYSPNYPAPHWPCLDSASDEGTGHSALPTVDRSDILLA